MQFELDSSRQGKVFHRESSRKQKRTGKHSYFQSRRGDKHRNCVLIGLRSAYYCIIAGILGIATCSLSPLCSGRICPEPCCVLVLYSCQSSTPKKMLISDSIFLAATLRDVPWGDSLDALHITDMRPPFASIQAEDQVSSSQPIPDEDLDTGSRETVIRDWSHVSHLLSCRWYSCWGNQGRI